MRARVGDLAIVKFDSVCDTEKYEEHVGIVIASCHPVHRSPEYRFVYWDTKGRKTELTMGDLPRNRLVRARPISGKWNGELSSLTRDDVEPV